MHVQVYLNMLNMCTGIFCGAGKCLLQNINLLRPIHNKDDNYRNTDEDVDLKILMNYKGIEESTPQV